MNKLTITRINRTDKTSKAGKPYISVGVQFQEKGDTWINGFNSKSNEAWKDGDILIEGRDIVLEEKEFNGKTYLNFNTPDKTDQLEKRVSYLETQVKAILEGTNNIKNALTDEEDPFS